MKKSKKRSKKPAFIAILIVLLVLFVIILPNQHSDDETPIGGQRDDYGCLTPAGYSYNETLGICLREWEIKGINRIILEQALFDSDIYGLTVESVVADENCPECYKIWIDTLGHKRSIGISLAQTRQYCSTPRSTDANAYCIEVYDPVCGVGSSGELNTFSNSCFACLNSSVAYYFNGEC